MTRRIIALLVVILGACHQSSSAAMLDMATLDMTTVFTPALHDALPPVPDQGGPTIGTVKLVTISYAGSAFASRISTFGDYVVTSDWYKNAGAEYGVQVGTHTHVELPMPAPATLTSDQLVALLATQMGAGTLPAPDDHTIYLYFAASETDLTDNDTYSCTKYKGTYTPAYHYEGAQAGQRFAYGVVPTCDALTTATLELAAAHEFIEASTDPFPVSAPAYFFDRSTPWYGTGGEVADICDAAIVRDGHTLTRVWSNVAVATGGDPCLPADTPFFSVTPSPTVVMVAPGGTATFTITGWSLSEVPAWYVVALPGIYASFDVTPDIDVAKLANGTTAQVTVTAPSTVKSGDQTEILVYSSPSTDSTVRFVEPIAIHVM